VGTTVGNAAADAGSNGHCATDETPSRTTSAAALLAVAAIARETAAAATSEPISTRRRLNRSPIQPAPGVDATDATTPEKIAADTHRAEPGLAVDRRDKRDVSRRPAAQ
jgi:hypothetical protein